MSFDDRGVPSSISDLSIHPDRPRGSDNSSSSTTGAHIRTLYAFIAQLNERIASLEAELEKRSTS